MKDKVPEAVPELYRLAIDAAIGIAELAGHWQQPQVIIKLPQVQLPESIGYLDQVGAQHNHNSYLYLLDAPQTDSDPSILPKYRWWLIVAEQHLGFIHDALAECVGGEDVIVRT